MHNRMFLIFFWFVINYSIVTFGKSSNLNIESDQMYQLLIGKKTNKAQLWTLEEGSKKSTLIKTYKHAFGRVSGDKVKKGDLRTPEGIYFPVRHINTTNLSQRKYSDIAVELNYPNPFDRMEKKTGYGIWLHGAGNDKRIAKKQVTEGCVAFYNKDMLQLSQAILPNNSIINIAEDLGSINDEKKISDVLQRTEQWKNSWEKADLRNYSSYYSKKFSFSRLDLKSYITHKKRIFSKYKKMSIDLLKVYAVSNPKYVVVLSNQFFKGDNSYSSVGKKILYWVQEKGEWKILREIFEDKFFGQYLGQAN